MKMKKQNEDEDEGAYEKEDEEADEEEDAEEEDKNGFVQHLEPRACVPSWTSGVPSSYEERQKKNIYIYIQPRKNQIYMPQCLQMKVTAK